jgi:hypothetical protein
MIERGYILVMIREICNRPELKKMDLRALRLTSKYLCEQSSDRFAKNCFKEITVLNARSSLRTFIELSHHPRFGPAVEVINISPCFVSDDGEAEFSDCEPSELLDGSREVIRTFLNRSYEERELDDEFHVERMLNTAFKAFAQRKQSISLGFRQHEWNAIGARNLILAKYPGEVQIWQPKWKIVVERTTRAVFDQGCKIYGLRFEHLKREDFDDDSGLCTDGIKHQLSSICSQLSFLDVEFQSGAIETTAESVEHMVSEAKNLEILHLYQIGNELHIHSHYFRNILNCVASSSLQNIVLNTFQLSEAQLFAFLGRQRGTLRILSLSEGCLLTGNCMSLIAWIRDNVPGLVYLELEEIYVSPDHTICGGEATKSYLVDGNEDMQARLADILNGRWEE